MCAGLCSKTQTAACFEKQCLPYFERYTTTKTFSFNFERLKFALCRVFTSAPGVATAGVNKFTRLGVCMKQCEGRKDGSHDCSLQMASLLKRANQLQTATSSKRPCLEGVDSIAYSIEADLSSCRKEDRNSLKRIVNKFKSDPMVACSLCDH
jgi:hypothetical protein